MLNTTIPDFLTYAASAATATSLMLLNPGRAEAAKLSGTIRYEAEVEVSFIGTDTDKDNLMSLDELEELTIHNTRTNKALNLPTGMVEEINIDVENGEVVSLDVYIDESLARSYIELLEISDAEREDYEANPGWMDYWVRDFDMNISHTNMWVQSIMRIPGGRLIGESTITLRAHSAWAEAQTPPQATHEVTTTTTASTPEPSLSLLGFITLGGFMLGSRKKEKA